MSDFAEALRTFLDLQPERFREQARAYLAGRSFVCPIAGEPDEFARAEQEIVEQAETIRALKMRNLKLWKKRLDYRPRRAPPGKMKTNPRTTSP